MRIKITFLRHGETDGNVEGIYQGQMNYNLTLNGQNQAKITSNYLQNNNNWLLIFSSDLTRAKKTAEIILQESNRDIITLPILREMCFGICEGLPKKIGYEEAIQIYSERLGVSSESIIDHAETFEDVVNRQKQFIEYLVSEIETNFNNISTSEFYPVLIVTHGRFIKIFLQYFCSLKPNSIDNCSISTLEFVVTSEDNSTPINSNSIIDNSYIYEWISNDKKYRLVEVIPYEINNVDHLISS